jgi:iron complex outermembrane recepter protein
MKKILSLFVFVFLASQIFAQSGVIKGKITDKTTGKAIERVEVKITPSNSGYVTDKQGLYAFTELNAGTYTIQFSHLSYENYSQTVTITANQSIDIDVVMKNKSLSLSPFELKADELEPVPYVRSVIDMEMIEQGGARDLGDFLRTMPNVSAVRKGGTGLDPVIRGFKFSQLNIQLNTGQSIEGGCPNRMDPTMSHVEVEEIERIEVYKGPYALRYGATIGGVVNLITTQARPYEKFEIHTKAILGWESNWNGYSEHVAINGGNKFVFFRLSGGNKDYGNYYAANSEMISSSFNKFYINGQLGFQPIKNHKVLFTYTNSQGRDVMYASLPMDERIDNTHLFSFDYHAKDLTPKFKSLDAKIYSSKVNHTMDNKNRSFSDTVAAISFLDPFVIGDRLEAEFRFNENSRLFIGQDYKNTTKSGDRTKNMIAQPPNALGQFPIPIDVIWNNAEINNVGFFTQYDYKNANWGFMGAARIDMNQATSDSILIKHPMMGVIYQYGEDSIETSQTNFSFSAAVTKYFSEKLSLSLALGRSMRSPDMTERFIILLPVGFDKFDYLGNPTLLPETNNEVDLTLKYSCEKLGGIEINAFYAIVNNYITSRLVPPSVQKPLSSTVMGVKEFYNAEQATFMGFELAYATPSDLKWGLKISAAYTMATLDEALKHVTDSLGAIIDDEIITDDPLIEIPPMELNASIHYKFLEGKLIPRVNFRYVAEQSRVSDAFYEESTPGFYILDMGLSYKYNENMRVNMGVNNLFNELYYEHLNRRIIGSSQKLYEPGRVFYVNLIFNI